MDSGWSINKRSIGEQKKKNQKTTIESWDPKGKFRRLKYKEQNQKKTHFLTWHMTQKKRRGLMMVTMVLNVLTSLKRQRIAQYQNVYEF